MVNLIFQYFLYRLIFPINIENHLIRVEKYRPKSLDELISQDSIVDTSNYTFISFLIIVYIFDKIF